MEIVKVNEEKGYLGKKPSYSHISETLDSFEKFIFVDWDSSEISSYPLVSFAASDSSYLVVFNEEKGGLSHIIHYNFIPDKGLFDVHLDELIKNFDGNNLIAFVLSISDERIKIFKEACIGKGISLNGKYIYPKYSLKEPKDIIVIPKKKEIQLYTSKIMKVWNL